MSQEALLHAPLVLAIGEPRRNLLATGGIFIILGACSVIGYLLIDFSQVEAMPEFTLLVGIVFLLIGISVAASVHQVRVDKDAGYVETIRGVFIPLWRKALPLSDFSKITLMREKKQIRRSSKTEVRFPVRLEGKQQFVCCEFKQFHQAQSCIEKLARYLQLPVEDATSGAVERREVDEFL